VADWTRVKPDAIPLQAARPDSRQLPFRYVPALVWIVALTVVGVSLAIRITTGAIPENDDWSYVKSALEQHDSHRIVLQGFGQMFLIGQLTASQPFLWIFGANARSLDVFSAVAGIAWIWLVFLLARGLIGERRALLLVCVVAAWPALGLLSTSFMTDVPSTAAAWAALYFGIKAFETERKLAMLASFVFAVVAFTVREQTIVVPIAVSLFALIDRSSPRRLRYEAIGGGACTIAVCYLLEHARRGLPNADVPPFGLGSFDLLAGVNNSIRGLFTLGFALSPLVLRFVILSRRR
jgi:4-amino-4-deoxy-L-arabinose transferase-like glycosyltransferase